MERFKRVDERRVRLLQEGRSGKGPVIYWLNREQRAADNWALLYAQDLALRARRPLLVIFCLQTAFLGAGTRHFHFMLTGLQQLEKRLQNVNIPLHILDGPPQQMLPPLLTQLDGHSLVTDFNPLKIKQQWQQAVSRKVTVPLYEVDAHNIVPCWQASSKREYAAYTFRPKINLLLPEFLTEFPEVLLHPHHSDIQLPVADWRKLTGRFQPECSAGDVLPVPGEEHGRQLLDSFIRHRLCRYDEKRNNPLENGQSGLSPYFHFGQLAPQRAALSVAAKAGTQESRDAYLEELIVRRELSDNFCYYCREYDSMEAFPDWAVKTLEEHRGDPRQHIYSEEEFTGAQTHEPLWNCCQQILVKSGKLHGYLRMYWAKKILEWSESPEEALRIAILLNDTYSYDGRDPNGYAGIAWSIGGVHDRAWPERPVFGKIRYMNEKGCRRKFKVDALIAGFEA
ncbi:MAG: deoxyribodipyrimidine photo-lyase [Desulforhopalus sp.]